MSRTLKTIIAAILFLVFVAGGFLTTPQWEISNAISYPIMLGGLVAFVLYVLFVWRKKGKKES